MQPDSQTDLVLERVLEVPRALVWTCWTTPEHLMHFFIPRPHRVTACEIDLTVGGRFNTTFDVDGAEIANQGVFLQVIPQTRLVFTDTYTEGWKPNPEPFMTAILDLADEGACRTRYRAMARHRSAEARQTHEDMGFHTGWGIVVDQLEAYAKTLP
jgi:uncharacterized protein YndB with AHSA1/START domain|tara:strand:- start:14 stop:481 length:468 start_codon:yes stop_codon:yes gene_type:complete